MNLINRIRNRNPFLSVYERGKIWKDDLGFIGEDVQIFHKVSFGSEPYLVYIGDKTKITYGCSFITHDGGIYVLRNLFPEMKKASIYGLITVGKNCFLGNNVTILPGVTIGDNCIIAAGSIVSKSIPEKSVAGGVPCRVLCTIDEYYEKNEPFVLETLGLPDNQKRKIIYDARDGQGEKRLIKK